MSDPNATQTVYDGLAGLRTNASATPRTDAMVIDATFPDTEVVASGFCREIFTREQAHSDRKSVV
jgi:hypothetical protein